MALDSEARGQVALAKSIRHPGESGRAREQILIHFLERLIPPAFGIDTGFIIDARGNISNQIDVLIYRKGTYPIFNVGGIKHFIVESVVAVIQVKASITSVKTLTEALENIKSAKVLDRTGGSQNLTMDTHGNEQSVDPEQFFHQIFGAIVAENSLAKKTLSTRLLNYVRSEPPRLWPNMYVDAQKFVVGYTSNPNGGPFWANPYEGKALAFATHPAKFGSSLIKLAQELLGFLRVAPHLEYKVTSYLYQDVGEITWYRI